jgi:hypothetical protein
VQRTISRALLISHQISFSRWPENRLPITSIYFACFKFSHYWKEKPIEKRCCAFALSHLVEQRAVVGFFTLKGLNPKDIHTELESVHMAEALCLRTIYKWHKHFIQGRTELLDDPRSGRPLRNDRADTLRAMIQEFPFTSCNSLCTNFRLAMSTCLCILHDVLRFKKMHFTMGLVLSRRCSKGWTDVTFHIPFESSQRKSKEWICSDYNRRQIVILFWLPSLIDLGSVQRWGSRKNQRVPNCDYFVGQ